MLYLETLVLFRCFVLADTQIPGIGVGTEKVRSVHPYLKQRI